MAHVLEKVQQVAANVARVIRGKDDVIRKVLLCLMSRSHVLLEDLPGVGKTKLARALAKSLQMAFKRIQFTPDMLPGDITGVTRFEPESRQFLFVPGPVFTNMVLADEINRGTPRVQSALLECMEEQAVTVDGVTHALVEPFFVMATKNPQESYGTYPLPESEMDRFQMCLSVGYPEHAAEMTLLQDQVQSDPLEEIAPVMTQEELLGCQEAVKAVAVSEAVRDYIATLMEGTRAHGALRYGCSPRAALALMHAAQAQAVWEDRDYVMPRDVRDLACDVLNHRISLNSEGRHRYASTAELLQELLESLPLKRWEP